MSIPLTVIDLVERFERNIESYKFGNYNEQQTRNEFINPFFEALGWDVSNKQGYAEAYKDVIHEYSQKTADSTEAPDYLFRIGGTRKFFVEAKKPSIKLADETYPAYQLRRYAWTAKLPLSILTDFEEFAVYDCRIKPNKNDKPSVARVNYYTYKDYIEKWEEIASVFSKDSILKGSFDKYAEINKAKRGTAEVDDAFLKEIEHWREILAKNIAIRNPKLTNRELNFAVQKTIDRIIFLRICEDRGIEEYGQLMSFQNGVNVYVRMMQIFNRADEKYNSGLFHFGDEKGRIEPPDIITPKLKIDDKTLKDIIKNLYYPESPYEFSVLPADILGHVYEQFLGKVIRLTTSHQAKIDEKPEVKKAGGVYYTPTYIVDYIVKNTVGKLLEDKTPNQIVNLRILDPACGSGSFLLGAYQYLLDWHLQYYVWRIANSPYNKETRNLQIYQAHNGEWKLTTAERKRILLNNIYGVDIDPQAVEVTKLSLLLKVLEGETDETLASQMKFFHERALPDLSNNIKCGNSLIGPDFYEDNLFVETGHAPSLQLDDEERMRINVFDWNDEFKDIMSGGGFDVVIGNPPYLAFHEGTTEIRNYFKENFSSAIGKYDQYILFIEKSLTLLKKEGRFSFIIPNKFIQSGYGEGIKSILLEYSIEEIVDFNDMQIFKNATNYPCIMVIKNEGIGKEFVYKNVSEINRGLFKTQDTVINQTSLGTRTWILANENESNLLQKIRDNKIELKAYTQTITQGLRTGYLSIYFNEINHLTVLKLGLERDLIKTVLHGKNVKRYHNIVDKDDLLLFPYSKDDKTPIKIDEYPNAKKYLTPFKSELLNRKDSGKLFGQTNKPWYEYWDPKPISFSKNKIIFPDISNQNNFYLDEKGVGYLNTCYAIIFKKEYYTYNYFILGILNSQLMNYFMKKISPSVRGGYYRYKTKYVEQIPIPYLQLITKDHFNKMNIYVKNIIQLYEKLKVSKLSSEKESLHRQITAIDNQIDQLVYELYGLTEEEIKIVEGNS